jgi:SAM-dependent methyltransferase
MPGRDSTTKTVEEVWAEGFEGWQDAYLVRSHHFIRRVRGRPPVSTLRRRLGLKGNETVLEAGCGGGVFGLAFATIGCEVVFLDYSMQMLRNVASGQAVWEARRAPLRTRRTRQNLFHLGLATGAFDLTFSDGVIEHWRDEADRRSVLREMARVTRPDGHVCVTIPNNTHPFAERWRRQGMPWLQPENPLCEAVIPHEQLREELAAAGLCDVWTDGYDVMGGLIKWPKHLLKTYLARGTGKIVRWFPRGIRMRWGGWMMGVGRVSQ